MSPLGRLVDPASVLRLVTAAELVVGHMIVVQGPGLSYLDAGPRVSTPGHGPGFVQTANQPCVVARRVTRKMWALEPEGAYEIHWEGDEHDWAVVKPTVLFVVCERPA